MESSKTPLFSTTVAAGFPSPADDHIDTPLDLNKYLIAHPAATYFVKATGDSMKNAGIYPGDILIVDKAIPLKNGAIIIASLGGDFTVKRYVEKEGGRFLFPENERYEPIPITAESDFTFFGTVTFTLHKAV